MFTELPVNFIKISFVKGKLYARTFTNFSKWTKFKELKLRLLGYIVIDCTLIKSKKWNHQKKYLYVQIQDLVSLEMFVLKINKWPPIIAPLIY